MRALVFLLALLPLLLHFFGTRWRPGTRRPAPARAPSPGKRDDRELAAV